MKTIREKYTKVISDKHEDSIAKFGAILAQGIIDAGMSLSQQCPEGMGFVYFKSITQTHAELGKEG